MSYKAVIFDLDGTLLDTLEDLGDATNRVLARHGFDTHPTEAYRRMVGQGIRILTTLAIPEGGRDPAVVDELQTELGTDLREHPVTKTKPYPGVPELLTRLAELRIPAAILTNKPDAVTHLVVGELLSSWEFRGVYGQRDDLPRKPDPAVALRLAEELGADPGQILFVGDSDVDMETALAAGMRAIGAGWGFRGAEELLAAGAHRIISHPLELLEHFADA